MQLPSCFLGMCQHMHSRILLHLAVSDFADLLPAALQASCFLFFWRCNLTRTTASCFVRFLDHTEWRTRVSRTPLDEWSARRRDLYLTTHNIHNRQTSMSTGGIRTHDLSKRAVAVPRLRPGLHWNQNRHNTANQYLSGHTSPDTCSYIYSDMSVQTYSYCSSC